MKAQVILTPTESKKFIAKGIARMDLVRHALSEGIIVLHPSSSTYFIFEALIGATPESEAWVCGWVGPHGMCLEMGVMMGRPAPTGSDAQEAPAHDPGDFPHSWVIEGGKATYGIPLKTLFERMGPDDVYIKGVNAIDPDGNAGVLIGNTRGAGTIGRVMAASQKKGFNLIFPVGLEKLIPVNIREAARVAKDRHYAYAMGIPCWLFPVNGITVTEIKAVDILSGATAVPIAAGGLGGAGGAITLVLEGEDAQVTRAIEYVEASKGARLPEARKANCRVCQVPLCAFPPKGKHWIELAS